MKIILNFEVGNQSNLEKIHFFMFYSIIQKIYLSLQLKIIDFIRQFELNIKYSII